MINFKILGIREVINKYKKIRRQYPKELKDAMWEIVLKIEADAKVDCPTGLTGNLRRSIKGIVSTIAAATIRGEISASTEYAAFVHEGTSKQGSQPFIMNALRKNRKFIEERLGPFAFNNVSKRIGR